MDTKAAKVFNVLDPKSKITSVTHPLNNGGSEVKIQLQLCTKIVAT